MQTNFLQMTMKIKNYILFSTIFISQVQTFFFGTKLRWNLSLFIERSTRVDFFFMYYANAINFIILAYCLHYPKNLDKRLTKLILFITCLDFLHLLLFAKRGYGMAKVCVAILYVLYLYRSEFISLIKGLTNEIIEDLREIRDYFKKLFNYLKKILTKWQR